MSPTRRRGLLVLAALVVGALLVTAGWVAFRAWTVQQALTDTARSAREVRVAAARRDLDALDGLVDQLQRDSATAVDRTGSWAWRLVGVLPGIGDDADTVTLVASVVDELARTGLEAGVEAASGLDRLTPADGAIDLDAVRALEAPTGEAAAAVAAASGRLDGIDAVGLVSPLRRGVDDLVDELDEGASALQAAHTAAGLLPGLLGGEGERRYLAIFQNNAEARSTGGLPGSVAELRADDGEISLVRQVAGKDFGRRPSPVLPLTQGEQTLFGSQLGTFFLDAGFTPDLARAAELWRARWEEVYPGRVDGVLTLDTVALSYLVGAMGAPVVVDGVRLDEETLVDELLHETYLRLEDPAEQDLFFGEVSAAVFERVRAGAFNPERFLRALAQATAEGRLQFDSTDPVITDELVDTRLAGPRLAADEPGFLVTFDDKGADKMTYFLRATTRLEPRYCSDGRQAFELVLRLSSVAPPDAAELPEYVIGKGDSATEPGDLAVTVRLYSPPGASLGVPLRNGQPTEADAQVLDGRTVSELLVRLAPGEVADLTWRALGAPGETGAHDLWVTPTLGSGRQVGAAPAC